MNEKYYKLHKLIFIIPVLLFTLHTNAQENKRIQEIEFKGLKRSHEKLLKRCIHCEEGENYDSLAIAKDAQRLRNTLLFSSVDVIAEDKNGGKHIRFEVEEKLTVIPSFNGGVSGDDSWFQLGVIDFHFLGRGINAALFYKQFRKASVYGYAKAYGVYKEKWGFHLEYDSKNNFEPVHMETSETPEVEVQEDFALLALNYEFKLNHWIQLGLIQRMKNYQIFSDEPVNISNAEYIPAGLQLQYLRADHLNTIHEKQEGWSFKSDVEFYPMAVSNYTRFKAVFDFRLFQKRQKFNFANRFRLSLSEKNKNVYGLFAWDSFDNIRGAGKKLKRGNSDFTWNSEVRYSFLENKFWAAQLLAFNDISFLNDYDQNPVQAFRNDNFIHHMGLGFRAHFKKIAATTLRIDYGLDLAGNNSGFVIGLRQYF